MTKQTSWKPIAAVVILAALELMLGPGLLYFLKSSGIELYSASTASQNPAAILLQWGMCSVYPAILIFWMWKRRPRTFFQDLYLTIQGKRQKIAVLVLGILLAVMSVAAMGKTGDLLLVVLNLLYYLIVVAFAEEVLLRGICPFLLRAFPKPIIYLLPNLLFAALHIFAYHGFQGLHLEYILEFLSSQMLGLVLSGMVFQLLKEYTGTLWIPILIHAILDFSSIFSL